jgi:hypothetical protein
LYTDADFDGGVAVPRLELIGRSFPRAHREREGHKHGRHPSRWRRRLESERERAEQVRLFCETRERHAARTQLGLELAHAERGRALGRERRPRLPGRAHANDPPDSVPMVFEIPPATTGPVQARSNSNGRSDPQTVVAASQHSVWQSVTQVFCGRDDLQLIGSAVPTTLADGLKGDLALVLLIAAPQHADLVVGHGPPTKRWTCHVLTHPHHDSRDEFGLQALRIVVEVPAVFVRPKHAERAPEVSHAAFRTMRHPMRLHQHAQHILHDEQTCKLRH